MKKMHRLNLAKQIKETSHTEFSNAGKRKQKVLISNLIQDTVLLRLSLFSSLLMWQLGHWGGALIQQGFNQSISLKGFPRWKPCYAPKCQAKAPWTPSDCYKELPSMWPASTEALVHQTPPPVRFWFEGEPFGFLHVKLLISKLRQYSNDEQHSTDEKKD